MEMRFCVFQESDMAFVPFAPNIERSRAADFSTAFWHSYFTILSGPPRSFKKGAEIYFTILGNEVWLALILSLLVMSVLSYWAQQAENQFRGQIPPGPGLGSHFLAHYGSLLGEGFGGIHHKSLRGRLLSCFWLILALVMICCFSGGLRVKLTFGGYPELIDSLSDLLKYPKIRPVTGKGTVNTRYIEGSKKDTMKNLWQKIIKTKGAIFHKELMTDDRLEATYLGHEAIISDMYSLEHGVGLGCKGKRQYHFAKETFFGIPMVIATRKGLNSSFIEKFNQKLLTFAGSGHVQKGFDKILEKARRCKMMSEKESEKALSFKELGDVFKLLGFGLAIGTVLLVVENLGVFFCKTGPTAKTDIKNDQLESMSVQQYQLR